MKKRLASGYTFTAASKTITHADFSDITLAGIQLITNVTDGIIIYNFADSAKGGTLATDTLTLEYDTTSMSDTDELMILVEDGTTTQAVSGTVDLGATDNAVLDAIAASAAAIEVDADTLAGTVSSGRLAVNLISGQSGITAASGNVATNTPRVTLAANDPAVALLGTIDADTGTIATPVATIGTTPLQRVAIFDAADTQITSFGGGTQYTEADTDASITGTAMMMEGAANALVPAQGTAADGLLVNLGANNDVTVTGTVAVTQSGTWDEVGINDSGNSITVDAPVATPVFVRLSDGAAAISTLPVSLASVPSHAVTNAGTFAVQVDGAALTALQLIDNIVGTEDAGETAGGGLAMAGSVRRDTAASSSGTTGDNSTINTSAEGALWVTTTPTTTSGLSISRDIDLDNSTLTVVKASAGNLYGYYIANTITSNIFVKFYNATSGTLGTGTPVLTFMVPAGSAANVGFAHPISFATGICVGATTDVADAGTTDPGANACIANIFYK